MKSSPVLFVRLIVGLIVIVSVASVRAAEWTGTTSTDWNVGTNWSTGSVPGSGVNADCRMTGANYTINYDSAMSAADFGYFNIGNETGYTTTLNVDADGFISKNQGSGINYTLNLGVNGVVNVEENGYARFSTSYVSGGTYGYVDGTLNVNGGDVAISGETRFYLTGTMAITDGKLALGGLYTYVGGTLDIDGGEVTFSNGRGRTVGSSGFAHGTLNMTGGTVNFNASSATYNMTAIGSGSNRGTMNMSGGTVNNYDPLFVGPANWAGARGILNLSGGQWIQQGGGTVYIGYNRGDAQNQLNVTNTGLFTTTGDTIIGQASTSALVDTLNINGGTYTATNANGDATLTVNRGELKVQSGSLTIDRLATSLGAQSVITFTGGTMTINDSSTVDNDSTFQVGNGSNEALLVVNGGTHSFADGLAITSNAALQGTGTVTTPAGTTSTSVASGGTLIPGNSIGTLTITNDLSLADGASYDYEISSSTVHDLVAVGGDLTLPGAGSTVTLNLSLVEPRKTLSPTNVELFTYGGLTGYTDLNWNINLIGDYWLGTPTVFDNESGTIYLNGITFIPEPASIALLGLGALALMRRKRRSC